MSSVDVHVDATAHFVVALHQLCGKLDNFTMTLVS